MAKGVPLQSIARYLSVMSLLDQDDAEWLTFLNTLYTEISFATASLFPAHCKGHQFSKTKWSPFYKGSCITVIIAVVEIQYMEHFGFVRNLYTVDQKFSPLKKIPTVALVARIELTKMF